MRRQFTRACLMSAFTCVSMSPFVQSAQLPTDATQTQVGGTLGNVNNAVDKTQNAIDQTQNNIQQSAQVDARAQQQLNQQRQQNSPTNNGGIVDPRSQGTDANRQQNQYNNNLQSQSNLSAPGANQSSTQPYYGTTQSLPGNAQGSSYQSGATNQWQGQPNQQWQNSATSQHGQVPSGRPNPAHGVQQGYNSQPISNQVYVLRHDASGREFICVNGRAVYFDNPSLNSAQSQSNVSDAGKQYRSGYGSYEAENVRNQQTQALDNAAQANRNLSGQENTQDRSQADLRERTNVDRNLNVENSVERTQIGTDGNSDGVIDRTDRSNP